MNLFLSSFQTVC